MSGAEAPLRLVCPDATPKREPLAEKPSWWLQHVERNTRAHRELRAKVLRDRGVDRANEAFRVHQAIVEGYREELGLWPLSPQRELPGASPEIKKIIRHWDTQIKTASRGTRRLIRADRERVESWCRRVLREAERRIESTWHQQRARGQLERFRRVARCAEETRGVLVCKHCHGAQKDKHGNPILLSDLCGSHLLCQRCRAHRRKRYRAAFLRSRLEAIRVVRSVHLAPGMARAKRDPLTERFLTLTCPAIELELGGPETQARIVRSAFRGFMNALRNHWRKRGRERLELSRYVRVVEATSGQDERGHCHIHVWLLSPFIRAHVYRALWGRALLKEFRRAELEWPEHAWKPKSEILAELLFRSWDREAYTWARKTLGQRTPWPRVDIKRVVSRETHATVDGLDLALELVKYLTKDLEASTNGQGGLVLMHPATFAAVYRGLDSGRMLSASRGFWVKYHAECQCCGAQDTLRPVELLRPPAKARAPPGEFRLHSVS